MCACLSLLRVPLCLPTPLQDRFLVEAMVVGREVTEATSLLFKANPKAVRQAPPVLRQPD